MGKQKTRKWEPAADFDLYYPQNFEIGPPNCHYLIFSVCNFMLMDRTSGRPPLANSRRKPQGTIDAKMLLRDYELNPVRCLQDHTQPTCSPGRLSLSAHSAARTIHCCCACCIDRKRASSKSLWLSKRLRRWFWGECSDTCKFFNPKKCWIHTRLYWRDGWIRRTGCWNVAALHVVHDPGALPEKPCLR